MLLPFTKVVKATTGDSLATTVVNMNPNFFTKSANETSYFNQASHRVFVPRQMLEDAINKVHRQLNLLLAADTQHEVINRAYASMQISEPAATAICVTLIDCSDFYEATLEAEFGFTFATLVLEILRCSMQRTGQLDESTRLLVEVVEVIIVLRVDGSETAIRQGTLWL